MTAVDALLTAPLELGLFPFR
ncbi:hypothetical protein PSEUDO8O_120490 [Pseudomonas sp. 8O]|nr:hypothetical protein PSEUDO8O_120490 [Pseudomonas sp. 8O]